MNKYLIYLVLALGIWGCKKENATLAEPEEPNGRLPS